MYLTLAALAGCLLGSMIFLNGVLAAHVGPAAGSFLVHGVGALVALGLILVIRERKVEAHGTAPRWSYLGGVFGALLVIITGVTVNSVIGVSGTVAMLLLGQILMGAVTDQLGWFGLPRRPLSWRDVLQVMLVLSGCGVLLHG